MKFSNIVKPLTSLTKKDKKWEWTKECQKAFEHLKESFAGEPVLSIPNPYKSFRLATDASKVATGTVLSQKDTNGNWKSCGFLSKTLTKAERNYKIYDRELLAIIRGLKEWRHLLMGSPHPVSIIMDHLNLTYFSEP